MIASLVFAVFNDRRWVIRGWSLFSTSWLEDGEYRWRWTAEVMAWIFNNASGYEEFYKVELKP